MAKIHLVLKKKNDRYYFSNPKRQTENELFASKDAGAEILCDLVRDDIISESDAIELLNTLLNVWDIPYGDPSPFAQFESDAEAIKRINNFREKLRFVNTLKEHYDLPIFRVCPGCGEHGRILGQKFMSVEFHSKDVAFESINELIGKGVITRAEESKLRQQINESSLPEKDANENCHLNWLHPRSNTGVLLLTKQQKWVIVHGNKTPQYEY